MQLAYRVACSIGCCLVLLQGSASAAHHSALLFAFDAKHPITLSGTVVDFRLVNPHSSIVFDAPDEGGAVRQWQMELGAASSLRKAGWNSETLKVGQRIIVTGAPAKDRSPAVSGQHEARITLADSNTVIYDEGRPVWLSFLRLFRR